MQAPSKTQAPQKNMSSKLSFRSSPGSGLHFRSHLCMTCFFASWEHQVELAGCCWLLLLDQQTPGSRCRPAQQNSTASSGAAGPGTLASAARPGTSASPQPTWLKQVPTETRGKRHCWEQKLPRTEATTVAGTCTCTCRGTLRSLCRWTFSHWDLFELDAHTHVYI